MQKAKALGLVIMGGLGAALSIENAHEAKCDTIGRKTLGFNIMSKQP